MSPFSFQPEKRLRSNASRRHIDFVPGRSRLARSGNDPEVVAMAMTLQEAIDFASVHADTDPYGIEGAICYEIVRAGLDNLSRG
jgi:hypothetical protein